jgi:ABC-type multidrug transport system ATPase subunit
MMNQRTKLIYELRDLKKDYGKRTVLQIGRLQFHPGTIYGIIGPVGSGKSTLLRLLAGREKQTSGMLKYDDSEFKSTWFGKLKGNENIFLASVDQLPDNQRVSQIVAATHPSKTDLIRSKYFSRGVQKTFWEQPRKNLSPGECAWLNMILAVESDPRVLLIDDYGTVMDSDLEYEFRRRLRKMNRELGTTIILATPSDHQVKRFVAVLIYLDNGHVAKIRPGAGKSQWKKRNNM